MTVACSPCYHKLDTRGDLVGFADPETRSLPVALVFDDNWPG